MSLRAFLVEPTVVSLGLAVVCILVLAGVRPGSAVTGMEPDQFWARKILWRGEFDVVVTGDSRVQRGVSPEVMAEGLGTGRIANLGFSSLGYGPKYMDHVGAVFDPGSSRKILVMGITPNSLTWQSAHVDNGFLGLYGHSRSELFVAAHVGEWVRPFRGELGRDVLNRLGSSKTVPVYGQEYRGSGYVASEKVPEDPGEALASYRDLWGKHKVSEKVIEVFWVRVGELHRAGVLVYGFEPPVTEEMRKLEDEMSGWDKADFVLKFKAAGGVWLEVPLNYHSYDGSHLRKDGAEAFSRDLAAMIASELRRRGR